MSRCLEVTSINWKDKSKVTRYGGHSTGFQSDPGSNSPPFTSSMTSDKLLNDFQPQEIPRS